MKIWWKYNRLKKKILKKELRSILILKYHKLKNLSLNNRLNSINFLKRDNKNLNCYPNICKKSNKFKKNVNKFRLNRWELFHNLKKGKIPNTYKYIW